MAETPHWLSNIWTLLTSVRVCVCLSRKLWVNKCVSVCHLYGLVKINLCLFLDFMSIQSHFDTYTRYHIVLFSLSLSLSLNVSFCRSLFAYVVFIFSPSPRRGKRGIENQIPKQNRKELRILAEYLSGYLLDRNRKVCSGVRASAGAHAFFFSFHSLYCFFLLPATLPTPTHTPFEKMKNKAHKQTKCKKKIHMEQWTSKIDGIVPGNGRNFERLWNRIEFWCSLVYKLSKKSSWNMLLIFDFCSFVQSQP